MITTIHLTAQSIGTFGYCLNYLTGRTGGHLDTPMLRFVIAQRTRRNTTIFTQSVRHPAVTKLAINSYQIAHAGGGEVNLFKPGISHPARR